MAAIGAPQLASQSQPDRPRADDLDVPVRVDLRGDILHERSQVLIPRVLDPVLDGAPAAVAPGRMDPDMARRVVMDRHVRLEPFDTDERRPGRLGRLDVNEPRLPAVDPDDRHTPPAEVNGRHDAGRPHDSAQAGMPSRSTARSPKVTFPLRSHPARSTRTACRWLPAWNEISGPSRIA